MKEIWKDIKGFEGYYQVSNLGRVKGVDRIILKSNGVYIPRKSKILKQFTNDRGYLYVDLRKNGRKSVSVHRLVMLAFVPEVTDKPEVNHKNGNKLDNRLCNLEWNSRSENVQHCWDNGMGVPRKSAQNIEELKSLYKKGLNFSEIAKIVGISSCTVSRLLVRDGLCTKEGNNYYKLNRKDVKKIRQEYVDGKSLKELTKQYPVTECSIRNVINRKTWK